MSGASRDRAPREWAREAAVEVSHLRKAYGENVAVDDLSLRANLGAAVQATQDSIQGTLPPAGPMLVMAAYTMTFGFAAWRFFRWE
jgi:hypothetical protein